MREYRLILTPYEIEVVKNAVLEGDTGHAQ